MKKQIQVTCLFLGLSLSLAACTTDDAILGGFGTGGAAVGGLVGNALGGGVGTTLGAAAVGSVAGALLGTQIIKKDGKDIKVCKYRLKNGKVITKPCK